MRIAPIRVITDDDLHERNRQFETLALPHLDSAYNIARWLLRDEQAADDVVQEAFLRALRYFASFRGTDVTSARPWLLGIVRNACYAWLHDNRGANATVEFDEEIDGVDFAAGPAADPANPEQLLAAKQQRRSINDAIERLPAPYREVLILREMEELNYEDIARIAGIPAGTVMSRLSRARAMLRTTLAGTQQVGR